MTEKTHRDAGFGNLTAFGCGAILVAQAAAVGLVLALSERSGARLSAVALAALITGIGGLAGWLVARISRRSSPAMAAAGGLAATALRLLPPMVALAWVNATRSPMAEAGLGGLLVGFYLSMLLVAIFLHILETRGEPSGGSCKETI